MAAFAEFAAAWVEMKTPRREFLPRRPFVEVTSRRDAIDFTALLLLNQEAICQAIRQFLSGQSAIRTDKEVDNFFYIVVAHKRSRFVPQQSVPGFMQQQAVQATEM